MLETSEVYEMNDRILEVMFKFAEGELSNEEFDSWIRENAVKIGEITWKVGE